MLSSTAVSTLQQPMPAGLSSGMPRVAYFCMELAIDQALYTYSGGLGYLAGGHLRSAHELGLPMVAISLLWRYGYGEQRFENNTIQLDYHERPLNCLTDTGKTVNVTIFGDDVTLKIYLLEPQTFGTVPTLFLSSNTPENTEEQQQWCDILYGGDEHARVAQEIILGVGGVRALRALGWGVDVYHMNEGHALPLAFELLKENGGNRNAVRDQVVFTTHTPVPAGNEVHEAHLLAEAGFFVDTPLDEARRIGGEPFSLTEAALRLSRWANGVSQLHGDVANRMWQHVEGRCPISAITNGVNQAYWQDTRLKAATTPAEFWQAKQAIKSQLLADLNLRTGKQLDPNVLTLVWARRFTGYKRSTLVLRDQALVERWLGEKKIQILIAGKFHPRDTSGREGFEEWLRFAEKHPNVAVLPNYELTLSKELKLMGDVWLNTPRRPLEASGTSGMSANLNGAVHCTTHADWSVEGTFHGINGFLINAGDKTYTSDEQQDEADYQALRHVLQTMVIPTYWENPTQWQQWVWRAKETAESQFNTHRMVLEYYQRLYGVLTPHAFQYDPSTEPCAEEPVLAAV